MPTTPFPSETATVNLQYFGTARARIGYLVTPTMLLYGTGGLAWARAKFSIVGGASIAGGPNLPFAVSDTTNFVGWAAGVGGDWMFMPNWTVGVEYLHLDLGDANFKFSGPYPNATTTFVLGQGANISLVSDVVRGTLNYRFWARSIQKGPGQLRGLFSCLGHSPRCRLRGSRN